MLNIDKHIDGICVLGEEICYNMSYNMDNAFHIPFNVHSGSKIPFTSTRFYI